MKNNEEQEYTRQLLNFASKSKSFKEINAKIVDHHLQKNTKSPKENIKAGNDIETKKEEEFKFNYQKTDKSLTNKLWQKSKGKKVKGKNALEKHVNIKEIIKEHKELKKKIDKVSGKKKSNASIQKETNSQRELLSEKVSKKKKAAKPLNYNYDDNNYYDDNQEEISKESQKAPKRRQPIFRSSESEMLENLESLSDFSQEYSKNEEDADFKLGRNFKRIFKYKIFDKFDQFEEQINFTILRLIAPLAPYIDQIFARLNKFFKKLKPDNNEVSESSLLENFIKNKLYGLQNKMLEKYSDLLDEEDMEDDFFDDEAIDYDSAKTDYDVEIPDEIEHTEKIAPITESNPLPQIVKNPESSFSELKKQQINFTDNYGISLNRVAIQSENFKNEEELMLHNAVYSVKQSAYLYIEEKTPQSSIYKGKSLYDVLANVSEKDIRLFLGKLRDSENPAYRGRNLKISDAFINWIRNS